jgi:predicted TIM-barrel fold metal-dependent hydrolase
MPTVLQGDSPGSRTLPLQSVWDCNARLGHSAANPPCSPTGPEALLEVMDEYGIDHALVYHALAKENSPALGNALLGQAIAQYPRLHPCWVVLPPATGELPAAPELMANMRAAGVQAVRLCPNNAVFVPAPWALGALLEPLEASRVPVFLDFDTRQILEDRTDWRAVYELGHAYPRLPFIVVAPGLKENRITYSLMEALPNIHFDLSTGWQHRRIQDITERWGARRLLFGTNLPFYDPGGVLAALAYAEISAEDRTAIGGGNLRRLLSEVMLDAA